MSTIQIKGMEQLKNGLKSLPKTVARRIMNNALKKAAEEMRTAIVRKTPIDKGNLIFSIKSQIWKENDFESNIKVGSHYSPWGKSATDRAWYAHLIEYGHKWVIRKVKGGPIVDQGYTPPRPFMRPAFDENVERIKTMLADQIGDGVQKALKRMRKR